MGCLAELWRMCITGFLGSSGCFEEGMSRTKHLECLRRCAFVSNELFWLLFYGLRTRVTTPARQDVQEADEPGEERPRDPTRERHDQLEPPELWICLEGS